MSDATERDTDDGVIMAMLARRAGMTEGQLYTAVIAALVVAVLTLTGLPGAHDIADPTGAGSLAPPAPATSATSTSTTTATTPPATTTSSGGAP